LRGANLTALEAFQFSIRNFSISQVESEPGSILIKLGHRASLPARPDQCQKTF